MSKRWNRAETWLALVAAGIGLLIAAIAGLHAYMTATASPVHPDAHAVPSTAGVVPPAEWTPAVGRGRALLREQMIEHNLPGVSVAVGLGDALVWSEGFGWADLDRRVPVTPDTVFRIGTASTVLTSAAAGLLLERGALRLDADIRTYVPDFPEKPWPVTLQQVMAHVAGLRSDGGDESPLFGESCRRARDALAHVAGRDLQFEPGTRYHYSRYGWIVVSAAIEAAAGEALPPFMREAVFDPLQMAHTRTDREARAGRATSYFPRYAADPRYGLDPMRPIDTSCYSGAGTFVSTPPDLVRFGLAMANDTLLQRETTARLQTSQRLADGTETGYGLGWDLETITLSGEPVPVVGYDGDLLGGMVASLLVVPDRGIVVAVTSNTSYADTAAIAAAVAEAFAGYRRSS